MAVFEARECQKPMIAHVINNKSCNVWGSPGVGKTSATICALDMLWLLGSRYHPALVLAPKRVARDVWAQEAQKWDQFRHLKVERVIGTEAERVAALGRPADIYVMNYENVQWLVDYTGRRWPFRIVIADEATSLKGFRLRSGSKRAAALAKIRKATGRWVNLTGTPASNGLRDLWGQNWFVDRGHRLGASYTAFENRWFIPNPYTRQVKPTPNAHDEICAALEDVTLTVDAKDYFDLPPLVHNIVPVSLPPNARKIYLDMESKAFAKLQGEEGVLNAKTAAEASLKCLQIACGGVYVDDGKGNRHAEHIHDAKIEALKGLVAEMAGQPLLVAYQFKFSVDRILSAIPGSRVLSSESDMAAWNRGEVPVGLGHPASIGKGLSLAEGGHHLALFGLWWDLEQYLQMIERIGPTRQAQLGSGVERVFIHSIVAVDTLDEEVIERREGKKTVQDLVLKRMKKLGYAPRT